MRRVVVDASVALKWLLPDRDDEEHVQQALALLESVRHGGTELLQPPHWLAEVGAVLSRLQPELAMPAVRLFDAMEIQVCHDIGMYARGIELATALNHHLFDTLYHAVALADFAEVLVTADLHYYRKAAACGGVLPLSEFTPP